MKEEFLNRQLRLRKDDNSYRQLPAESGAIDFSSNDYLGVVRNSMLDPYLNGFSGKMRGSTGSRLISGNYPLIEEVEQKIARFHESEAALIFNSGYDANLGLLSAVAHRGDTILYDSLCHASIRDGIRLSHAQSFSFAHNSVEDLEKKLTLAKGNKFVVSESVFSMDGDTAPLSEIVALCDRFAAHVIIDEAHATGTVGSRGQGLVQLLNLQNRCFARMHSFGKAAGCHGAAIVGTQLLKNYLINFSRPFIYTTALPECTVRGIRAAYDLFPHLERERQMLTRHIQTFRHALTGVRMTSSQTAVQAVITPGNERAKGLAERCLVNGFDVKPILHPTVPKGSERLRVVLHAFNTIEEVQNLTSVIGEDSIRWSPASFS